MRRSASVLALVCATGCTVEWRAPPVDAGAAHEAGAAQAPDLRLGALHQALEARLRAVEAELERVAAVDQVRASELSAERLLWTVALRELDAWVDAGGEGARAGDVDTWAEVAQRRIDEAALRVVDGRMPTRDTLFDLFGASADALAGEEPGGLDYKRRTTVDFGDDTIDGSLLKPDDQPLDERAPATPKPPPARPEPPAEDKTTGEDVDGWAMGGDAKAPAAAVVVADSAPPVDLVPAVRRHYGPLLACFPPADLDRAVHLDVIVRLAEDGMLRLLRVSADRSLTPATSSCVGDVLARVRVASAARGSSRVVTFPFTLTKH